MAPLHPVEMPKIPPPSPSKPLLPWTTRLFMSLVSFIMNISIRRDGSINRRLLSLFDFKAPPNPKPIDGVASSDHTVGSGHDLKFRLFSPADQTPTTDPLPVVVYFHGGGFAFNSAFTPAYDALCRRLACQIHAHVISVNYRLAPEHRYPAAHDDGLDVLDFLDTTDLIPGISIVFLAGDSAGGSIAHHVARRSLTTAFKKLTVTGLIAIQPFFGGEEDTESESRLERVVPFGSRELFKRMWRAFLPVGSSLDHEVANVFGPGSVSWKEDWDGFPTTMVVVGGFDTLQDRQRWYCEGLKRAGADVHVVEYPMAVHGFFAFPELPEADEFVVDVKDFVRKRLEEVKSTMS